MTSPIFEKNTVWWDLQLVEPGTTTPVNVTGSTFTCAARTGAIKVAGTVQVLDAVQGQLRARWDVDDLHAARWEFQVTGTFPDGGVETFWSESEQVRPSATPD